MTPGTYGPTSSTPFAFYDRPSHSLKTSRATFPLDSMSSSLTLPRSGSMRGGALCGHRTWELPTDVDESSSLLPTPTTDMHGSDQYARGNPKLNFLERLLPTPVANDDHKSPEAHLAAKGRTDGCERTEITSLDVMARQAAQSGVMSNKLLPTPAARDGKGRDLLRDGGPSLPEAMHRLLPTPRTSDSNGTGDHGDGGPDLRTAVEHLLPTPRVEGFRSSRKSLVENQQWSAPSIEQALELARGELPREYDDWSQVKGWHGGLTPEPSPDGSESSDGQLPLPWTSEDG